jgi:4a-hydroxytetrahydrobiopterin dehydratase
MTRTRLTSQQLQDAIDRLDGWTLDDGKLARELVFGDFARAFGFMTSVALVAQAMDHHPDWSNVYDRVSIRLHTHDSGGITARDVELASQIDALAAGADASPAR